MNNPCTSNPASRNSRAETAESTPPDMPTMTVPGWLPAGAHGSGRAGRVRGSIGALYRRRAVVRASQPSPRELHEHLAHLRFLHAGLPHLVEEIEVAARIGRIVHVRNAVPAIGLQAIHQGPVTGEDEGAGAGRG